MTPQPWYWNVDEVESATAALASLYPTQATLIGGLERSADLNRDCHALRLALAPLTPKPTLVVIGGIHGVEWGSCEIIVNFATDLLKARRGSGFGLAYPNITFSAAEVASILDNIDIVIFPLVNPDGREFSQRKARAFEDGDTWRKNRNQAYAGGVPDAFGVDINRNFPFLFDVDTAFLPGHFGSGVKLPAEVNFRGPEAFSEPETRNVRALLDMFPTARWMIDLHSNWQVIRLPWSDDTPQFANSQMNFANSDFDGQRGEGGGYGEYMPAKDLGEYVRLGQAISTAMTAVANRPHPVKPGFAWGPMFGMSHDYAYSRERAEGKGKIYGFLLEWGDNLNGRPNPDWVDMEGTFLPEAVAGLVSFCIAAEFPTRTKDPAMNLTRALPLATCVILAACATTTDNTDKTLAAAVSPKIVTNCIGNAMRNTCIPGSGSDPTRCHVFVIDRGDKPPFVYPGTLMTPRPDVNAPPIVIIWHLAGAEFRNRLEGPDLWSNAEFSVGTPTDSDGDTTATGRSSHFKFRFLNTTVTDHKYSITFVNSLGHTMTCDPTINNSGS